MRPLRRMLIRFAGALRRSTAEEEMAQEIELHLEMQTEANIKLGMSAPEARRAAILKFGGVDSIKEACRDQGGLPWIAAALQDFLFGLRILRQSPGFTAAAVLTLALGIGAATALFSVAHTVIFRPLHFPHSNRVMTVLATVGWQAEKPGSLAGKAFPPFDSLYVEWRDRQQSFDLFAAALTLRRTLRDSAGAREIPVALVSADFLPLIGAAPALGRLFTSDEDLPGHDAVALLDYGFWQSDFSARPGVLGQSIQLEDRRYTIIGVLPPDLHFPTFGSRQVWVPLAAPHRPNGGGYSTLVVGRLRDGVTREAAEAEMNALTRRIHDDLKSHFAAAARVTPLREWLAGPVRTTLLMLAGAAGCLLLIACANLANLLLARGTVRRREMAIRAALGAGRARLALQMVMEGLLLTLSGGALGLLLAWSAIRLAPAIHAIALPRMEEIVVDRQFFLIGFAISLVSGILFGLAPVLQVCRRDLQEFLHRGEVSPKTLSGQRFRSSLVVAQIALSMVLLTGAGLMTNTLLRLLSVDLGFSRSGIVSVEPTVSPDPGHDRAFRARYLRELADRMRSMPGVESVSVANAPPLHNVLGGYILRHTQDGAVHQTDALGRDIDPGYLKTLGIPLLAGRDFEPADASAKPVPLILNQTAARVLFGAESPIGKVVECLDKRVGPMRITGIVGDVRVLGVAHATGPEAFVPLMGGWGYPSVVVARARTTPPVLAPFIRTTVHQLDPASPPPTIAALDDVFDTEISEPRFYMLLLDSFALVGLILAATGVYGVISYAVARRRHEFGVRMALGARPRDIVVLILNSGVRMILAGTIIGLAGAIPAARLLASLLFQVQPHDPLTLAGAVVVLSATGIAACWLSARFASTVDVNIALRQD